MFILCDMMVNRNWFFVEIGSGRDAVVRLAGR
jgi:hypothetical protein